MKFCFPRPHHKQLTGERSANLRIVLIAAPMLVGLGIAIYLRRKQVGDRRRESSLTIEPEEMLISESPLPIGEAVGEPQIQSDAAIGVATTSASLPSTASEPVEWREAKENVGGVHEFKIPTLIPPLTKLHSNRPNVSTADPSLPDTLPRRTARSRRRDPRRVAAAGLSFLVAAAVVYGTVGAVRSHEKKTGPLLFSDAISATEPEAPAEAPKLETPPSGSPTTPPTEQPVSPTLSEASAALPTESASPEAAIATPQHQRKHARRSHSSRHAGTVNRKSKTPVPWKISF